MTLGAFVGRLGLSEVARRVGVSQATVRKWLARGVSNRFRSKLEVVVRRHLAAVKGYETKQRRKRFPGTLPLPPEPYIRIGKPSSGVLFQDQILPNRAPVETQRDLERVRRRAGYSGSKRINTDEYYGESEWVPIGQPILELDIEGLANNVVSVWRASRRVWCHVRFLLFRYIPHNPIYRGELVSMQGKWVEWWVSTNLKKTGGSESGIRDGIEIALANSVEAGYSRMIWIEAMNIRTFDNKEDLPTRSKVLRRHL